MLSSVLDLSGDLINYVVMLFNQLVAALSSK